MTIRRKFRLVTAGMVALVLTELALVFALLRTQDALAHARTAQHRSRLLAHELRYSSDELTRTARTYAVTGDPAYRDAYWRILAVRDGQAPRPDGRQASLRHLFDQVGLSPGELALLKKAEDNSNALVATEVAAFQAMAGRFMPEGKPFSRDAAAYTRQAPPDRDFATRIMHDGRYHADKSIIMDPIEEFEVSLEKRTDATVRELAASTRRLVLAIGGIAVAMIVLAVLTHFGVQQPVLRSIRTVTAELRDLAQGGARLSRRLHVSGKPDEISGLAAAFNATIEKLSGLVQDVRLAAASVVTRAGEMGDLLAVLFGHVEQQQESTNSTTTAARQIAATSGELRQATTTLAEGAEKTSRRVNQGQDGLNRIGSSMAALLEANQQIVAKLSVINEKASRINSMADVVRKVAEQTNLLSLNAAIEAEKAGEYGLGFAVVAREVRRLADQSAGAIQDIEAMVRDVRSSVGAGVMEMDKFRGRLAEAVSEVENVRLELSAMIDEVQAFLPLLEDFQASFSGQNEGVQQIHEAMSALSAKVKATVETLDKARDNRRHVEETGRRLRELVEEIKA